MKHLSAADRDSLARQLETLRLQAIEELRSAKPGALALPGPHAGQEVHTNADDAQAEVEDEVRRAQIDVDRRRLEEIEQAQQRLAEGRYGICVTCGEDIALPRLQAQPMAIRCAACQARHEAAR